MKKLSKKTKQNILTVILIVLVVVLYLYKESNSGTQSETESAQPSLYPSQTYEFSSDNDSIGKLSLSDIPEYTGKGIIEINANKPYFTEDEMNEAKTLVYFEYYGDLDSLGRCTVAYDCLGVETMPVSGAKRGDISEIHPSGWHQRSYDCINQNTLMTRTHLAGWMLSAENANEKNLISGTRYMNADSMLEYEEMTENYLYHNKGKHVLYRITPMYNGDELVARGILMEARSVEDNGKSIEYCVYVYNVQPGIKINYSNGWSDYTGIFFDISAPSVQVGNLELYDFEMDMSSHIIHAPQCSECKEAAPFKGDIDAASSWPSLGYDICDCVYDMLDAIAA